MSTPESDDTVQTSEADVLRAEIDRLTERLSSAVGESMQRAEELVATREKLRKCQHYSATADSIMEQMRRAAQKERAQIIDALGMDRDNLPEMVDELFPVAIVNLRAEVARLTEELATSNMAFDGQSKAMALMIAERDVLREQNVRTESHLRGELETAHNEIGVLRQILSDCVSALGDGSSANPDCTVGFFGVLPGEIRRRLAEDRGATTVSLWWQAVRDALTTIASAAGDNRPLCADAAEIRKWANNVAIKIAHNAAFVTAMQNAGPAVRLEWSPWEDGYTQLTARFGRLNRQIASIHNGNKVYATIDVSDVREDGDVAINISGVDMKQVTDLLRESLISLAGLTMPPVPTIPESA